MRTTRLISVALALVTVSIVFWPTLAAGADLQLSFRGLSENDALAVREYERIWREDGARIVAALERRTGVSLPQDRVRVIVHEASSRSGGGRSPMHLRASYDFEVKRGTLVHELAHRYLDELRLSRDDLSIHQQLNLILIPVWRDLWGESFLAPQVRVESRWSADYRHAWNWALSLSEQERATMWETLQNAARQSRP